MSSKVFATSVVLATSTLISLSTQIFVNSSQTLDQAIFRPGTGCITKWFDLDDPNGNGDYELLADLLNTYPGEICPNPIAIEAQTTSGQPASQTGNIFQVYNPTSGFACVNANQVRRKCADYKVRFTCPEEWCSRCRTRWFDQDDPSRLGDIEMLPLILIRYPLQICPKPIAIEVATVGGTTVLPTENNFLVYDPTQGFACVNAQQIRRCQDYKVRFTCPMRFCRRNCWAPRFDQVIPSGLNDNETLSYPLQICPQLVATEVATISGTAVPQTGNNLQVSDALQDIECVNDQQGGRICEV
ncbi:uncharacterized protein LOC109055246 isoform X2 [Cyprinus carpio]|uniref:Uncharacterized protein LOC109055246 isoform X2 n=1 Tax=Cyprinus carpio TaxID=7962 RepID=A0A9R0ARA0_CYPCA|nr:uncharacterized protein LOC109055246 isoform X2 [Cyprinus carpio]